MFSSSVHAFSCVEMLLWNHSVLLMMECEVRRSLLVTCDAFFSNLTLDVTLLLIDVRVFVSEIQ